MGDVDETDKDDSDCIDHQVIHVDTKDGTELGGNTHQKPDH